MTSGVARPAATTAAGPALPAPRSALAALLRPAPAVLRLRAWAILTLALFFTLIHFYTGLYGAPPTMLFRMVHLTTALALIFLLFPLGRHWSQPPGPLAAIDLLLFAAALWLAWYYVSTADAWALRQVIMTPVDLVAAGLTLLLIAEAVRRTLGVMLLGVAGFFCLHALFADHFPGIFFGPPVRPISLLRALLVGDGGVFGTPLGVMAQYVVLFILFGQMLAVAGVGDFFLRFAFALFGHRTGGPAKAAVVSSAMMGTLSGSAIGNVLTTGAFTIPLMRRLGYRPAFAGGVEAAASTGGMLMPPVMGAIAFIMAEFMGRPYVEIALAALIPALLYFLVIFIAVDLEARRVGLRTVERARLPRAWTVLRRQGYLLAPIGMIIGGLAAGYSIIFVAVTAILGTLAVGCLRRISWPTPIRLAEAAEGTAKATVGLSATAAAAGIIIGAIFSTGLSFQVTQAALSMTDGRLWLLLALAALMAIILGMGITASAVYITMVATVVPILREAGVPEMAAHMFALYFGIVSNITPPVALAAFAAAPIAGADPMRTSFDAAKLGIAAFLIPVMFVYQPALLLIGTPVEIVVSTLTATVGLSFVAVGFVGYLGGPLAGLGRLTVLAGGLMMIVPELRTDLGGLALAALGVGLGRWLARRRPARPSAERRLAGAASGPLGRLMERRLAAARREEGDDPTAAADRSGPGADLDRLLEERGAPGGIEEHPGRRLLWGWLAIGVLAVAMETMGQRVLQATDPIAWLGAMLALAAALATLLPLLLRGGGPAAVEERTA